MTLSTKAESDDAVDEEQDPLSAAPASMALTPRAGSLARKSINLELNAQEPKSDEGAEGLGKVEIVGSSAPTMKAREIVMLSPQ